MKSETFVLLANAGSSCIWKKKAASLLLACGSECRIVQIESGQLLQLADTTTFSWQN
jgi:hypothetical protein